MFFIISLIISHRRSYDTTWSCGCAEHVIKSFCGTCLVCRLEVWGAVGILVFWFNDWFEGGELISLKASSGKLQLTFRHRSRLIFQMPSVFSNILSCWCLVGSTQACLKTASIHFPVFWFCTRTWFRPFL